MLQNINSPINKSLKITELKDHVGLDMVVLRYELDPNWSNSHSPGTRTIQTIYVESGAVLNTSKGILEVSGHSTIEYALINDGKIGQIKFNPARWLDPEGFTLCPIDKTKDLISTIIQTLIDEDLCRPIWSFDYETLKTLPMAEWPNGWEAKVEIKELHLARDFLVPDPKFNIEKLALVKKKSFKDTIYRKKLKMQTIAWGNRSWARCSFYDKSAEQKQKRPNGWYRFEIQAHRKILQKYELDCLSTYSEASSLALLLDFWENSGFSSPISLNSGLTDLVNNLKVEFSPSKVTSIIGEAYLRSKGVDSGMSNRYLTLRSKKLSNYGLSGGIDLDNLGSETAFLCLSSGSLEKFSP